MVLDQTVTNFATLLLLFDEEGTAGFDEYISTMDQQQLVDLLSYCISLNPYEQTTHYEHRRRISILSSSTTRACLDELMRRAVAEPF